MHEALTRRRRAWRLAHQLITIARALPEREGKDVLHVRTAEVCRAMGQPEGAKLELVQQFVRDVTELMAGYGLEVVVGCGYLSMIIGLEERTKQAWDERRDPTAFEPEDLNAYFEGLLIDSAWIR